ncbi:VAMP-like protein YKT61 isoform X2 [Iris pallida]|uniref:VAMP-like protein YKT61 isoform X2 n=1 Tax=Iris pallida TaxID=29817 RepID=A0AAX6FMT1_IRIPA|nr:VAMP-like protein YKT61 isoform X2 [Iris pallida]
MKITAIFVFHCPSTSDPVVLANATDISGFGFFQRGDRQGGHTLRRSHRRREDFPRPPPVRRTR